MSAASDLQDACTTLAGALETFAELDEAAVPGAVAQLQADVATLDVAVQAYLGVTLTDRLTAARAAEAETKAAVYAAEAAVQQAREDFVRAFVASNRQ